MNHNINLINKLTLMNKNLKDKYKNTNTTITPHNTLFILDWDDTLFPTTWTTKNNINLLDNSAREQYVIHFQQLDRILSSFLRSISKYITYCVEL